MSTLDSGAYSVEIRVRVRNGDDWRRGSGYVVAPCRILTALHVVIGPEAVRAGGSVAVPDRIEIRTQGDFAAKFPEAADASIDRGLAAIRAKANGDYLWRTATMLWPPASQPVPRSDLAILAVSEAEALSYVQEAPPLRCVFPVGNVTCFGAGFPRWTDERTSAGVSVTNPCLIAAVLRDSLTRFGALQPLQVTSDTPLAQDDWAGLSGTAIFIENSRDLVGIATQARPSHSHAGLSLLRLSDVVENADLDAFWTASQIAKPRWNISEFSINIGEPWKVPETQRTRVFVERPEYAARLTEQVQQQRVVVTVTGFGGHGKTELVTRWLHAIRRTEALQGYEGVFWHSIEPGGNFSTIVDELHSWLGLAQSAADAGRRESKVDLLISALSSHKLLVVLDNFERLVDIVDEQSTRVKDPLAFELLYRLKSNRAKSKFIVLSRLLPIDLPTSTEEAIDVSVLSLDEARELIKQFGLVWEEPAVQEIIRAVGFHPLALSLAARSFRQYNTAMTRAAGRGDPIGSQRYLKSLDDVFARYDEIIPTADINICILVSQIRQPCTLEFIERVLALAIAGVKPQGFFADLRITLLASSKRLLRVGLIGRESKRLLLHPVVKRYYRERITKWEGDKIITIHRAIAAAFREDAERAKDLQVGNSSRTAANFRPYFEQVYHLCRAGEQGRRSSLTEALNVIRSDIDDWELYNLTGGLAAWSARADLLAGFFHKRNFDNALQDGLGQASRSLILNEAGQCQLHEGSYSTAGALLLRKIELDEARGQHGFAAVGCRNLSDVYMFKGDFDSAIRWMRKSVQLASETGALDHQVNARFGLGFLLSLTGQEEASEQFRMALSLQEQIAAAQSPRQDAVPGIREIRFAEHLLAKGHLDEAAKVVGVHVPILRKVNHNADLALALRIQGDILSLRGMAAEWLLEESISLARRCDEPIVLVDCELAWCRSAIRQANYESADEELKIARARSISMNFQAHLINCDLISAMIAKATGNLPACHKLVEDCRQKAEDLGYDWFSFGVRAWGFDINP